MWILIGLIVGIPIGLVLIMTIVGAFLPKSHCATRSLRLNVSADRVWELVSDAPRWPTWNSNCKSLEVLPDRDGLRVWKFGDGRHAMTFLVEEFTPPRRMVTRISDQNLPFGGTWTYEIIPRDTGCEVRLTENGEIHPPPFRFIARFFIGYTATIDGFLSALAKHLGEPAIIR